MIGLGGIGRRVVALFDALGVEVWGMGRSGSACDVPGLTAALTELFIDNLARCAEGRPLRNRYDPARGY